VSVIIGSPDAEQLSRVMAVIYGLTPREQQVLELEGACHP
jgi:DNA-binding CsgD family transcriptional regulator